MLVLIDLQVAGVVAEAASFGEARKQAASVTSLPKF
jgi:hypothetical protein